jgi:hypothetical protein
LSDTDLACTGPQSDEIHWIVAERHQQDDRSLIAVVAAADDVDQRVMREVDSIDRLASEPAIAGTALIHG